MRLNWLLYLQSGGRGKVEKSGLPTLFAGVELQENSER
jgi:hypothetical protein